MDKTYPHLTSNCIHKNIFDMPLDILQSFINGNDNLNYQKYIFDERAKKNSETQKNGIQYNLRSKLVSIRSKYKRAREIIEKNKVTDTNETVNEINNVIGDGDFNKIAEDKLAEIVINPAEIEKYFTNETVIYINKKIKSHGFTQVQSRNQLVKTFKPHLEKHLFSRDDIKIILNEIKDSLNEKILKKAINVLTGNLTKKYLVNTKLLNAVETFLFVNLDFDSDNMKKILKDYIKLDENLQKVLNELNTLKNGKLGIYKAIDSIIKVKIPNVDLKGNQEIQTVVEKNVNEESLFLAHEFVNMILEQLSSSIKQTKSNFKNPNSIKYFDEKKIRNG